MQATKSAIDTAKAQRREIALLRAVHADYRKASVNPGAASRTPSDATCS